MSKAKTFFVAALATCVLLASCGRSDPSANAPDETTTTVAEASTTTVEVVVTQPPSTVETFTGSEATYIVASGDAFSVIADKFGVSTDKLAEFNAIEDTDLIKVGQTIYLPEGAAPVEVVTTTTTTTTEPEDDGSFTTAADGS